MAQTANLMGNRLDLYIHTRMNQFYGCMGLDVCTNVCEIMWRSEVNVSHFLWTLHHLIFLIQGLSLNQELINFNKLPGSCCLCLLSAGVVHTYHPGKFF